MQPVRMLLLFGMLAACSTTSSEKAEKKGIQVSVKNTGQIAARKASFLVLNEGKSTGPMPNDPRLLSSFSRIAQQLGRDVQVADDILEWVSQGSDSRYMLVIQSHGASRKSKKACSKLQILYFLPDDLQKAKVEPSFQQDIESCDSKSRQDMELLQAALRVGIRHLGRDGTFLDEMPE